MFWADKLLENTKGPQIINDSWTPSGIVHMGSLKGPVIHDVLYKILKERGEHVEFWYGIDDADSIDGLPSDLMESHGKYLGIPLYKAPSPDGTGSFADYFGNKMKRLLDNLGIVPDTLYKTSELYKNGTFNKAILFVLDHTQGIRKVYANMYKKQIADDWYPLQVVCPNCGKVGTTKVIAWDGKEVAFCCSTDLVKWAKGCGICDKISPFDGNSKMLYKVEWAAKWWTFGVTIEGAGKDHGSAGGSYDVAVQICKDVFEVPQPLKFVYEFFLSHGKKMSSSKGIGLTGEELLEVMGPQRARFLMIYKSPFQTIEFTPYRTDSIPKVFDAYQKAVSSQEDDEKTIIAFSQINSRENIPNIRFSVLAQWVQMPNMEEKIKKEGFGEWVKYTKIWVEKFAPEEGKFLVQKNVPSVTQNLSDKQKDFLEKVSEKLDKDREAEKFQEELYEWAKEMGLASKDAFAAIYLSLLGKDHGPKAAWLIFSLDKKFVQDRFQQAASTFQ